MASHSVRPLTQIDLKSRGANPLPSDDVPPASGNPSQSRNTPDSSNPQDNTAAKSKRNRAYPDKDGDRRTASLADRRHLTSTRPGVGQGTGRAKPSPPSDLHPSSQRGPADRTPRKDGATGRSNGKKRRPDVVGAEDASLSKSRQQNLPASNKPGLWQDVSFRVKDESPWRTYGEGYDLRVGGLVTVAKKKRPGSKMAESGPASAVVAIRKLSGSSRNANLSTLLRVQEEYFVKCTEAYEFGADLYVVLEHMPISLVQVVAAPVHPRETHVAAIVGQVLSAIKFLESENLVHGNISCSSVLLNDDGQVKISMQERCTVMLKETERGHPDVQALEDVMMQLLEKRKRGEANDLRRWSSTAEEFLSKTTSASAEELLQHAFLDDWKKDDLVLLVSITQVSSRRFYTVDW